MAKGEKITKTNVARVLDSKKIPYSLIPYTVDEKNLAAQHIADELGENIEQVFKTLVLHGDKSGYFVCVVPGNCEVDLKKAAKLSGNKKAEMIPMKDLLSVTGYIRGGCSPVGMKKPFPTWFHNTCLNFDYIYLSAGVRGLQIQVNAKNIVDLVKASIGDLVTE